MRLSSLRPLLTVCLALFFVAIHNPVPAYAAIGCSASALRNAVTVANGTPGADTIDLSPGCDYKFGTADAANPDSALPRISSKITFNGNNATIRRADDAATDFRLFYVLDSGNLTLKNVTVSGGHSDSSGGAIYVASGLVTLKSATISGNTANNGGGIYNSNGTVTVAKSLFSANHGIFSGGGIENHGELTITDSAFDGNDSQYGGGIYGTMSLLRTTFTENSATQGAGVYAFATLEVTDCEFSGNTSSNTGGGIHSEGTTATITNTLLSDNTAAGGGAIFHRNYVINVAVMTITNSVITGNHATNVNVGGGGILNTSGSKMVLIDSEVTGNDAVGFGGGIVNSGLDEADNRAALVVRRSTVSGNTATTDGGGIYATEGPLVVIDSIVSGNSAGDDGGGIFSAYTGTLELTNSVVSGNKSTGDGGGIAAEFATVTVDASTIAGNDAGTTGGALDSDSSSVTIRNAVVWGNDTQLAITATVLSVSHTTIQGGAAGTGNSTADPLFVAGVASSGAPTSAGDYHLSFASPSINSGNGASLPADWHDIDLDGDTAETLPYDHDGNPRIVNGIPDRGAFEAGQLLANRDFEINETGSKKQPDGWTLKSPTGDKLVCDTALANTGNCAFQFKGSAGEAAALEQKIAIEGIPFGEGDSLALHAFVKGPGGSAKGKLMVKVRFVGGGGDSEKASFGQSTDYTQISTLSVVLGSAPVKSVKAVVKHQSSGGKVYVDGARLIWFPSPLRGAPMPLPAAAAGLRGLN